MDVLEIYLEFSFFTVLITFAALIGYGTNKKDVGITGLGMVGVILICILFVSSIKEYHNPKAIEVYQGKTTLEYTVKEGVCVDSVVVYKSYNKNKNAEVAEKN